MDGWTFYPLAPICQVVEHAGNLFMSSQLFILQCEENAVIPNVLSPSFLNNYFILSPLHCLSLYLSTSNTPAPQLCFDLPTSPTGLLSSSLWFLRVINDFFFLPLLPVEVRPWVSKSTYKKVKQSIQHLGVRPYDVRFGMQLFYHGNPFHEVPATQFLSSH